MTKIAELVYGVTDCMVEFGLCLLAEELESYDIFLCEKKHLRTDWHIVRKDETTLLTSLGTLHYHKTLFRNKKTGEQDLKKFHGIMTKYVVEESGDFRRGEEGVFHGDRCIFMAPPARFISQLMEDLFEWIEKAKNNVHPLILSSIFHYEFVFIHPFSDGNGRMARLWHIAILSQWKPIFEYIPIESQIEKFQEEYYNAIARCHIEGESTFFIEFMLSQIDKMLDDISVQISEDNEHLSECVKKLLEVGAVAK